MRCFLRFVVFPLVICPSYLFGQVTIDEGSNWFKEIGRYDDFYSSFDFKRYSKADVIKAKAKYLDIVTTTSLGEWEGNYWQEAPVGHYEFTWSDSAGFVWTYTYHTLASLDHGSIFTNKDRITLRSEKNKGNSKWFVGPLIKVKFGESHFLVPQKYLGDFAAEAAGLRKSESRPFDYWTKAEDRNVRVFGLPVFPKEFSHLVRQPTTTSIKGIGRTRFQKHYLEDGSVYTEETRRFITLGAGENKKIRVGMSFYVDDLEERIDIVAFTEQHPWQSSGVIGDRTMSYASSGYKQIRLIGIRSNFHVGL